jgi:hypothetical protein
LFMRSALQKFGNMEMKERIRNGLTVKENYVKKLIGYMIREQDYTENWIRM